MTPAMAPLLASLQGGAFPGGDDIESPAEEQKPGDTVPMDVAPGKTYGPDDLSPNVIKGLAQLIQAIRLQTEQARIEEVRDSWERREFWNGNHWKAWSANDLAWQNVSGITEDQDPPSAYYINHYLFYGLDWVAVASGNEAETEFSPGDPDNVSDVIAAEQSGVYAKHFRKVNHHEDLKVQQAYYLYNDGAFFVYTCLVADEERFGSTQDYVLGSSSRELTPGVPAPAVSIKITSTPKAEVVERVYGRLETRTPPNAYNDDLSDADYLFLELELHRSRVRAMHPKLAEKITGTGQNIGSSAQSAFEVNARRSLNEGIGGFSGTNSHMVTYSRCWIAPSRYHDLDLESDIDELKRFFPDGVLAIYADETFCEGRNENFRSNWRACHAYPGTGQIAPSIGSSQLPAQKAYNDILNLRIDNARYNVPFYLFDKGVLDPDSWAESFAQPGAAYGGKGRPGVAMRDAVWASPTSSANPDSTNLSRELKDEDSQRATGIAPSVFGGLQGGAGETSSGYQFMAAQAMKRLSLPYGRMRRCNQEVDLLAVKIYREQGYDDVQFAEAGPGGTFQTKTVSVDDLKGEVKIQSSSDENVPMTPMERRALLLLLAQNPNPAISGAVVTADNIELFKDGLQLPDLMFPTERDRENQRVEIEDLKSGNPADAPVNQKSDNHDAHMAQVDEWVQSRAGRKARMEEPAWHGAVMLHRQQHESAKLLNAAEEQTQAAMMAMASQALPAMAAGAAGPGAAPPENVVPMRGKQGG